MGHALPDCQMLKKKIYLSIPKTFICSLSVERLRCWLNHNWQQQTVQQSKAVSCRHRHSVTTWAQCNSRHQIVNQEDDENSRESLLSEWANVFGWQRWREWKKRRENKEKISLLDEVTRDLFELTVSYLCHSSALRDSRAPITRRFACLWPHPVLPPTSVTSMHAIYLSTCSHRFSLFFPPSFLFCIFEVWNWLRESTLFRYNFR